jgi:hypothetical protein
MFAKLLSQKAALRIGSGSNFGLAIKEISGAAFRFIRYRCLIFAAAGSAAQVVEGDVGNDSVEPSVEAALKPESVQILVNPHETFLVNVPGIFGTMDQIEGQPQNLSVIAMHQLLERETVARLRIAHETLLFSNPRRCCLARISVECDAHPHRFDGRFRVARSLVRRISLAIAACAGLCPFCRFRMCRRPKWPLVSIRERVFPTIGQLTHSAASRLDAFTVHPVVTERVTSS